MSAYRRRLRFSIRQPSFWVFVVAVGAVAAFGSWPAYLFAAVASIASTIEGVAWGRHTAPRNRTGSVTIEVRADTSQFKAAVADAQRDLRRLADERKRAGL